MPFSRSRSSRALARMLIVIMAVAVLVALLATQGRGLEREPSPPPATSTVPWLPSRPTLQAQLARAVWLARAQSDATWYAEVDRQAAARRVVPVQRDVSPMATADESSPVDGERVSSTAYCLTGAMADGSPARRGAVAANRWPLGTRLRVSASPGVGEIVTVEDRIGSGFQLDFALPGDCAGAREWGRRTVIVEVLGDG